jgi:sugar O-acyltransferase (sialic acid O-acetyltransferase NeuD family)
MEYLYIVGAGGLGRELLSLLRRDSACNRDWIIAGFIDSRPELKGSLINGVPVLGGPEVAPTHELARFCIAVGQIGIKKVLVDGLIEKNAQFVPIRTRCEVGDGAQIGNSVLQLNATVSVDAKIGNFVYLDSECSVGHDAEIGDYCHIGRGVFIGGRAKIGEGVNIHSGAMIAQGVSIGNNAEIGLGAVVLRDVAANSIMIGNPARNVRM